MQFSISCEIVSVGVFIAFSGKPFEFVPVVAVVMAAFDYKVSVAVGYLYVVQMLNNPNKVVERAYEVSAVKSASPTAEIAC